MAPAQLGWYFHVNFMKMQHFWIQKMEKFSEPDFTKYETFLDPKINEMAVKSYIPIFILIYSLLTWIMVRMSLTMWALTVHGVIVTRCATGSN